MPEQLNIGLDPKGLYKAMMENDAITLLYEHISAGRLVVDQPTGMIQANSGLDLNTPWRFIKYENSTDCFRWHTVMWEYLKILPSKCLDCWKVVVAPKTLRDLWRWFFEMERMGYHGKCGIETRTYVGRRYGSYFYNHSLEEGQEKLALVLEAIDRSGIEVLPLLGQKAILKRGCTEYERDFGPSDMWEKKLTEKSLWMEKVVDGWFVSPPLMMPPPNLQLRTFRSWVEHAYTTQDETYKDFLTDSGEEFELKKPTVIYNETDPKTGPCAI